MELGVLDSSALLAVLYGEPGSEILAPILPGSVISAVNAAEVQAKLVLSGQSHDESWEALLTGVGQIIAFDARQAEICGNLVGMTKPFGLSLGDRACLALGVVTGLPVYTTDRAWKKFDAGCSIFLIR